jgi:hypothetical protein
MTQTVVVDNNQTIVVQSEETRTIITGIMGPPGSSNISSLSDIDKTQLTDGATLVYKADTAIWRATNILDNQILEAGQF